MILLLYACKTILVAGLLFGYYRLFLCNKRFHRYNRFYLLSIPLISVLLPLFSLVMPWFTGNDPNTGLKLLRVINTAGWEEAVVITAQKNGIAGMITWRLTSWVVYAAVALLLAYDLFRSFQYIRKLSRKYKFQKRENIRLYITQEPGTPFSFLRDIFWDYRINMESREGSQVFRHELYHVKKYHTLDILAIEFVLIFFWFNPFLHLIRKEIKVIHEFLADEYAASEGNRYDYAELLVWQTVMGESPLITHPFFHNHIKRRITMITNFKKAHFGFISRIMALPLVFLLVCAFATIRKTDNNHDDGNRMRMPATKLADKIAFVPKDTSIPVIKFVNVQLHDGSSVNAKIVDSHVQNSSDTANNIVFVHLLDSGTASPNVVHLQLLKATDTTGIILQLQEPTFTKVEIEAEYPGGMKAWQEYLMKHLKYPPDAAKRKIQGTVVAEFIVNKDGSCTDFKILQSPDQSLSDETLRVIKESGKWVPAMDHGQKVRCYKKQPMVFKL